MIGLALVGEILPGGYKGLSVGQIIGLFCGVVLLLIGVRNQLLAKGSLQQRDQVSFVRSMQMFLFFALIGGLGEALVYVLAKLFGWYGLSIFFNLNPHYLWMLPTGYLLLALPLTVMVNLFKKVANLPLTYSAVVFTGSLFAVYGIFLIFAKRVSALSLLVFALGIAVALTRSVFSNQALFNRILRRALPFGLLLVFLLFSGVSFFSTLFFSTLKEAVKGDASVSLKDNKPNVLLIVLDTVRAESMSLYGYGKNTTPFLDSLAQSSVVFQNAMSTAPWTLPAHASMFTGLNPNKLFPANSTPLNAVTPMSSKDMTLADFLSDKGYRTGGFVANLRYCTYAHGVSRGFRHYEDFTPKVDDFFSSSTYGNFLYRQYLRLTRTFSSGGRKWGPEINEDFLKWLGDENQPFFAFLNYWDAHAPYQPPTPFDRKFKTSENIQERTAVAGLGSRFNAQQLQRLQDAYDGSVNYLDSTLRNLFQKLEKNGVLQNTLVIITSDHGEHFGEHQRIGHTNTCYRQLLQVPLIIRYPDALPSGKKIWEPVSQRNLPATIQNIIFGNGDDDFKFPGYNLACHWNEQLPGCGVSDREEAVLSELLIGGKTPGVWQSSWPGAQSGIKSIITDQYHYIRFGDGEEELYNFKEDSLDAINIIDSTDSEVIVALRAKLQRMVNSGE